MAETDSDSKNYSFMHRSDSSLFTVNLMWLNVFWSSQRFQSWFSLSAYQSVLMKLQELYIWKTELWPCCWRTVMNVLEFCLDVKNQHCGTSYISANQTEKPEKNEMVMCVLVLRWTETKKSMLHGSISRAVKAEKEKEEGDGAEGVCRWGCGYTVSVSSIDWKSAG